MGVWRPAGENTKSAKAMTCENVGKKIVPRFSVAFRAGVSHLLVWPDQAPAPPLLRGREIARPKALHELRTILFSELA